MHMHMSAHLGRDTCAQEYIHDWDMCAHEYTHMYTCIHVSTYMPGYMLEISRDGHICALAPWQGVWGCVRFSWHFHSLTSIVQATHIHRDTEKHTHTDMCSVISTVI